MSRPLLAVALAFQLVAAWLPLGTLLSRCRASDLAGALSARTVGLLMDTLAVASGAAAVAFALGFPLAYLLVRARIPGAGALRRLALVPLLLPPLVLAISVSALLPARGAAAAMLVLGLGSFPLVLIAACDAFERADARAAEAALQAGGPLAALAVELRLGLPAALLGASLAFTFAAGDFAVCDYISSIGPKLNVYSDEIFLRWSQAALATGAGGVSPERVAAEAAASAVVLLVATGSALALCLALQRRIGAASVGGEFEPAAPLALGRWRAPLSVGVTALIGLAALAPLARLVFEAGGGASPAAGGFRPAAVVESVRLALERSGADLRRSVQHGALAAIACVPPALILAHAAQRCARPLLGRALALAVFLPLAAPGTLFAMGAIHLWNREPTADFYGSEWLPPLLFAGRFGPLAFLVLVHGVSRLAPALEEVGATAGARPATRLVRLVAPLLAPSWIAGALLVFTFSLRELDASVLVPAANRTAIVRLYNGVHFARDSYVAALALLLCACILIPWVLQALRPSSETRLDAAAPRHP